MSIPSFDNISEYCKKIWPSKLELGAGVICGAACTEMALRAFSGLVEMATTHGEITFLAKEALSANLGGAVFYGLCASHLLPGSVIVGAAVFTGYSAIKVLGNSHDIYVTSKIVGHSFVKLMEHVIMPTAEKVAKATQFVLDNIPMPHHPIWLGVALLVFSIGAYQFTKKCTPQNP